MSRRLRSITDRHRGLFRLAGRGVELHGVLLFLCGTCLAQAGVIDFFSGNDLPDYAAYAMVALPGVGVCLFWAGAYLQWWLNADPRRTLGFEVVRPAPPAPDVLR